MYYFEESFKYNPSNIDNLIILGFLNFREEIYEKAIKYFELATKVDPHNFMAEIQYGKCYQKLGNNREAYKVFRKLQKKYPDNREVLTYLIAISRDLNLPYDDYHQKMREIEDELLRQGPNIVYGQPPEENSSMQFGFGNQSGYNPNYQGEQVDFQSKKHLGSSSQNVNKQGNKFAFKVNPLEILPS